MIPLTWTEVDAREAKMGGHTEPISPEHQNLMRFYGAKTLADLVTAQARSIERLQSMRIRPDESAAPIRVREG